MSTHFCHQCDQPVRPVPSEDVVCPTCNGGFLEEIEEQEHQQGQAAPMDEFPRMASITRGNPYYQQFFQTMTAMMHNMNHQFPAQGTEERFLETFLSDYHGHHHGMEAGHPNAAGNLEFFVDAGLGRRLAGNPGDYFFGGIEQLLQHFAENDPNRYGPPPAAKSAIEGMPTVTIGQEHMGTDSSTCAVCKDDFEIGTEVKQMPCKHIYHPDCIFPWLEQHNSCPVCRFELPTDDAEYDQMRASGGTTPTAGNRTFSFLRGGGAFNAMADGNAGFAVQADGNTDGNNAGNAGNRRRRFQFPFHPFGNAGASGSGADYDSLQDVD